MKRDGRIAFLVHEPSLWAHYSEVWARLPREAFAVVLTRRFRPEGGISVDAGARDFIDRLDGLGYARLWARDVVARGPRFAHVVSNHRIGGEGARFPGPLARVARTMRGFLDPAKAARREFAPRPFWPMQIGYHQIRFMYGADVGDGWSLAEWNAMYDAFLCHGPNDEQQVARRFSGRTFQMGYPRYDRFFDPGLDVSAERARFAPHAGRRTVLWMPTFGEGACSIPHFARALQPLQERYNFVVRPHPISFREAPADIALLQSLGYCIDDDALRDMNRLYRVVDAVLCDYGGSAFGSLYLGKRMVLLAVPGSEDWYTVRNSSNLGLAAHYPHVDPEGTAGLPALLEDDDAWARRAPALATLASTYFADLRGGSAARAASILLELKNNDDTQR